MTAKAADPAVKADALVGKAILQTGRTWTQRGPIMEKENAVS
jgi:hypothetical protein